MQEFDYVVVGGGAGGCVVASRLSEDPTVSVCLLEAGNDGTGVLIRAPLGFALAAPHGIHSWHYETVPQPGLNGRRGFQPRGKALGGSTAINSMVYSRGHRSDYDRWAAAGNPGWSYADVLPLFIRSENNENFTDPEYHGVGGPLNVMHLKSRSRMNDVFLEACQSQGIPLNPDYNGAQHHGCMHLQGMEKAGERCSASRAFIEPHLSRPNLKVITHAHVNRLLLENRRAVGAEYFQGTQLMQVKARQEVILAGGAFGSPQLLMLSGIGPADHLQALGIPFVLDVPGVGQNLQDHITAYLNYRSPGNLETFGVSLAGGWRLLKAMLEWRRQRTGRITSFIAESAAYFRTTPEAEFDDISSQLVVAVVDDHARKFHLGHGYKMNVTLGRPKSIGEVKLADANSRTMPLIDPRYFSHSDDMKTLVKGTQMMLDILESPAFAPYRGAMLYHYERNNPQQIEEMLRAHSDTEYHPCGTCKMGPDSDPMAVVNAQLQVKGIDGLRIADAAIIPFITTNNTTAPIIMIGEKAADMIKADWR
jgi:choline dehydrogenase